jgi:hypothetical protein
MSATPETQPPHEMNSDPRYVAAVDLWCHLDQARHTALYNYLMASTILLLAWGTIFATNIFPRSRHDILNVLALAGVVISLAWAAYGARANKYVIECEKMALNYEKTFLNPDTWPFHQRRAIRGSLPCPASCASSTYIIPGVPILFCIVFIVLLFV